MRLSRRGNVELDANAVLDLGYFERQWIDRFAERIQDLARALGAESGKLLEGGCIVGLNELRELFRPELHEFRENLFVIADPRAFQSLHQHLLVCQMIDIAQDADAHAVACFALEFGSNLLAES